MRVDMKCNHVQENDAPPGQKPTYNFTLVADRDSEPNKQVFGGNVPSCTIVVHGCSELPHGFGAKVTIDLSAVAPAAKPAQAQAQPRRAQE